LRYEYKHNIADNRIDQLRKALEGYVDLDPYAQSSKNGQYTVRSIYFDTVHWGMYTEKHDGLAFRDKVRLRSYNDWHSESKAFLEIKRKYQIPSRKFRVSANYQSILEAFQGKQLDQLFEKDARGKDQLSDANRFFYQLYSKQLLPVVLISYEREPFIGKGDPENNLRITFDKKVRSYPFPGLDELFQNRNMSLVMPGYTVLEVKFNRYFPQWLKPIIAAFQLKREAISKYVLGLDRLQLPQRYPNPVQLRAQTHFWSRAYQKEQRAHLKNKSKGKETFKV